MLKHFKLVKYSISSVYTICLWHSRTTLMYAVQWDSEVIVEQLLEKGIDHSLKDTFGWSALQYAVAGKRKV